MEMKDKKLKIDTCDGYSTVGGCQHGSKGQGFGLENVQAGYRSSHDFSSSNQLGATVDPCFDSGFDCLGRGRTESIGSISLRQVQRKRNELVEEMSNHDLIHGMERCKGEIIGSVRSPSSKPAWAWRQAIQGAWLDAPTVLSLDRLQLDVCSYTLTVVSMSMAADPAIPLWLGNNCAKLHVEGLRACFVAIA
ncbi:hypothetical protein Acr_07g0014180 [Actinidia rufa]|uniref:Uncharacterized protein n=1 Tax=Actinidia rufa TaxID=165716 RepID=A0A7J0EXQ5_9ERIC|nr:hypothetical protein Acr_07g0014180 [Actinidia rufa]